MHSFERSDKLIRILKKLYKKDKNMYQAVMKKIEDIVKNYKPEHYKNLAYDMKDYKRVQIGSFVLIFKEEKSKIRFETFKHHDDVYKR